jgi:hypothetical protein
VHAIGSVCAIDSTVACVLDKCEYILQKISAIPSLQSTKNMITSAFTALHQTFNRQQQKKAKEPDPDEDIKNFVQLAEKYGLRYSSSSAWCALCSTHRLCLKNRPLDGVYGTFSRCVFAVCACDPPPSSPPHGIHQVCVAYAYSLPGWMKQESLKHSAY